MISSKHLRTQKLSSSANSDSKLAKFVIYGKMLTVILKNYMANKNKFNPGDVFVVEEDNSMGLVLNDGALLITGTASYSGHGSGLNIEKVSKLPKGAEPYEFVVPEPVKFAMRAVCVITGIKTET